MYYKLEEKLCICGIKGTLGRNPFEICDHDHACNANTLSFYKIVDSLYNSKSLKSFVDLLLIARI